MKKFIACLFAIITLCSCSIPQISDSNINAKSQSETRQKVDYTKSVWFTYYELQTLTTKNETADDFRKAIKAVFKLLKKRGFNTVTVQVRPCADAFYESSYFPVSKYCFGTEGAELKYDPLAIMTEAAHNQKLRIEAWINPYRVSQNADIEELSKNNTAKKWLLAENGYVYLTKSNIYFNPAVPEVTELIVNGVKEIAKNYDVDAIHFDDYFYPTTKKDIDEKQYKEYKADGGEKSLSDWRRDNVSDMIKTVYKAIKDIDETVIFGVSPAADIKSNYSELYADIEKWCTEDGYLDYICPQVYFGFKNENLPFMRTVKNFISLANCDLYIGLPLYKCGKEDKYAGDRGLKEFEENKDIISRQIAYISQLEKIKGYYIFSYSFLNDESIQEEVERLYSAMQ